MKAKLGTQNTHKSAANSRRHNSTKQYCKHTQIRRDELKFLQSKSAQIDEKHREICTHVLYTSCEGVYYNQWKKQTVPLESSSMTRSHDSLAQCTLPFFSPFSSLSLSLSRSFFLLHACSNFVTAQSVLPRLLLNCKLQT